jgi:hypothetical protein
MQRTGLNCCKDDPSPPPPHLTPLHLPLPPPSPAVTPCLSVSRRTHYQRERKKRRPEGGDDEEGGEGREETRE